MSLRPRFQTLADVLCGSAALDGLMKKGGPPRDSASLIAPMPGCALRSFSMAQPVLNDVAQALIPPLVRREHHMPAADSAVPSIRTQILPAP